MEYAMLSRLIAAALGSAAFVFPAMAAEPVPDLSGAWAREFIGLDTPPSGHGPIANLSRMPSGQGNINVPVGDFNDPILKPDAAALSKKRGEISLTGTNF